MGFYHWTPTHHIPSRIRLETRFNAGLFTDFTALMIWRNFSTVLGNFVGLLVFWVSRVLQIIFIHHLELWGHTPMRAIPQNSKKNPGVRWVRGGPLIWGILDPLGGSPIGISHLAGGSEVNVYSVNPGTSMYLHNPAWESGWIDPYLAYTGSIVKFNVIFERFSRKSRNFDQTD